MLSDQAVARLDELETEYIADLMGLVKIPSVSFPGFDPAPMRESAEATARLLRERGLEQVELLVVEGAHPCVYGEFCHKPTEPTVLCYAHHDVQPAGNPEKWSSDPFDPVVRNGRLYGRGAADDKGAITVYSSAVHAWLQATGNLPLNVKIIVDGAEEVGSRHLAEIFAAHRDKLQADALLVIDTGNFESGLPSITTSLRGIVACEVEVRALKQAVHSGTWGGPIPDPAMALCHMLASLTKPDGTLALTGVLAKVRTTTEQERRSLQSLPGGNARFRSNAGMLPGVSLLGAAPSAWETVWHQPALAINAMEASSRRDARNIVCDSAWARVSIRIVPDVDPNEVLGELTTALKRATPWGLECVVRPEPAAGWWRTDPSHPAFAAAMRALERGYHRSAVIIGGGGSIPFVGPMALALGGVPALLLGLEDPETAAHSENESLSLADWKKATRSVIYLFEELATVSAGHR